MRILVLNAGSSTLKASVLDHRRPTPVAHETIDLTADPADEPVRRRLLGDLLERLAVGGVPIGSIDAVGHRVVHGGAGFTSPVTIDDSVVGELDALSVLAPLHNPVAISTVRVARSALPDVTHVACFDTAFHATLDEAARRYPVPESWVRDHGIRRFGFHGLSVEWSVRRAAELLDRPAAELGLVVAHLGSGCSVTAVDGGRSVATSMGLTPLEGLMMATRSGSIDPGIVLRLADAGLDLGTIGDDVEHRSGLVAVGGTADMRALLAAEAAGDAKAALAIEMFVRSAAAGIAAVLTALPRFDALVFTAGIGEHAGAVRARIVDRLRSVGLGSIDAVDDSGAPADRLLSEAAVGPAVIRIEAREDLVIADATARLVAEADTAG